MPVFARLVVISLLSLAPGSACRGTLPPTEPPRSLGEGTPETRTNDAPTAGPLAAEVVTPDTASGGSSLLPLPEPHPGGTSGGGSAGSGIR